MAFQKGNQFGRGRPKISLNKPELLLPIIFQKAHINWAHDFCNLYKARKLRPLTKGETEQYNTYLDLMPYLCTKVQLKDLDASKFVTDKDKKAMTDQTAALIEALENNANPKPASPSKETGMADGKA